MLLLKIRDLLVADRHAAWSGDEGFTSVFRLREDGIHSEAYGWIRVFPDTK